MHAALHFSIGLTIGLICSLPELIWSLMDGKKMAPVLKKWLLIEYSLAIAAIAPSLLRLANVPEAICSSHMMNIFLFHPLLDKFIPGEMLIGEVAFIICFAFQYGLTLYCIVLARRRT